MLRNRAIGPEGGSSSRLVARQSFAYRGKDAPPTVGLGFKVFCFLLVFCTLFIT